MAEPISAWGIDIGQAGLKAIRLRTVEGSDKIVAAAFDYVPHPKILSQPDAIPEELIREAMSTFLERNKLDGDRIAISVPGQSSLAKFIKLPPVESSKVAEIVRYEARQQIPFDLNDVIWDFQPIGGGSEESGFMLEAEVGLFAMKRDLVYDALRPFTSNGKEVDLVQIAPLALYNYLSYDVLGFRKTADTPEPPASEDYYILLDMGADNTTLLVSNGRTIWIRNVPIGGNHFTRSLTREMKLTFAKAEHLKCNATKSPDPKAVFQAMRPVFNDYVSEIQRSIGYFGSVNRTAKIRKVIGVGNGFRLAGLQKFLQQNLQYDVERLESLHGVSGDSVLTDPLFMDNTMSFAVPYGLALQAIGRTRIRTSLLPPEIVMDRKIRSKKPWAVVAAAGLMAALGIGLAGSASVARSVSETKWGDTEKNVKDVDGAISAKGTAFDAQKTQHTTNLANISQLVAPLEKRVLWLEMLKAVNECLPRDSGDDLDERDITLQKKIRIQEITTRKLEDVGAWHKAMIDGHMEEDFHPDDRSKAPAGAGYIVTLSGYHLYNNAEMKSTNEGFGQVGSYFLENTLRTDLRKWTLERDGMVTDVGRLGISHPIVCQAIPVDIQYDPNARSGFGGDAMTSLNSGLGGTGSSLGSSRDGMNRGLGGGGGLLGGAGGGGSLGLEIGGAGGGLSDPGGSPGGGGRGMSLGGAGGGRGGLGGVGGGVDGAAGSSGQVLFEEQSRGEVREIEVTRFVLQFVWKPTIAKDRPADPPEAGGTDNAAASPSTTTPE